MYKSLVRVGLMIMATLSIFALIVSIIDPFNTDSRWINWAVLTTAGIAGSFMGTALVVHLVNEQQQSLDKAPIAFGTDHSKNFESEYFGNIAGCAVLIAFIGLFGLGFASSAPDKFDSLIYSSYVIVLASFVLNGMISYLFIDFGINRLSNALRRSA